MEDFYVLDSENCALEVSGKMNCERVGKKPSLGSVVRKRLSDITNSQKRPNSPHQDQKPRPVSITAKDYIEQLHKENMTLMRLLAERNKIIELTGVELTKMRINLQKVQQQNWHLAQVNSQMLAELNLGKDKRKAMQHELGCKVALLSAKNLEMQEKEKKKPSQETPTEERMEECECGEVKVVTLQDNSKIKTCNPNRRHQSRRHSLGSSIVTEQVAVKEKAGDKRQSARIKSEQVEPTNEKANNKRVCLRRQSARFKHEQEPTEEDLFEIEDAKISVDMLEPPLKNHDATLSDTSTTKEDEGTRTLRCETPALRRSSIGRPMRRAAEKVQSYKEAPLNVKIRRAE